MTGRRGQPIRLYPLVGCLFAAGLVAGCASTPGNNARTAGETSEARISRWQVEPHPSTVPADAEAAIQSTGSSQEPIPAEKTDYVPHHWPKPDQDLWSKIRAGFELDPNSERRSVRVWTQFYATHTDHLSASLQRARPFLWHVVQQVEKRDMPTEIALLPIVESGYNPAAKSYVGASGLWQFMPGTADHMSLPRDWWYDGRNDPIASTDAALNYLQNLNERYNGDWMLALAAYNAGPGRVDNAIARAEDEGKPTDYWDLDLPKETSEYVPQLLALRRIMMAPSRFGVNWPALANEPRTRVVKLPGQIDMKIAAQMLDMSEDNLRKLNPGMRRWASDPSGHAELLVPAARAAAFKSELASINPAKLIHSERHIVRRGDSLSRIAQTYHVSVASLRQANGLSGNRITVGENLTIPKPGSPARATSSEPSQTYVVQSGDTLWHIAQRYSVSVSALKQANGHNVATLHPGQQIDIPGAAKPPAPTTVVVQRGDSLWSIAQANDVSVADLRRWNRMGSNSALSPGTTISVDGPSQLPDFYEVEPGDSLWSIADRFSMQVNTLRSLNDMSSHSKIQPGQRLRLQPAVSG
ncbi:LysM peptidoglycan-binding domain-containing protein [Salinisphaera sp. Q1T1-3]|uniref:LysM peptidoglycan-binding domain-containing protein n=1 Tax=Salinisphaera sp. Q1T1-3 TaxID=2321229 RepID=UPI0013141B83|nr:LysM peptidoglycan-binding domain-containing protein [Salinisphaera sp. Q1T1-3]